MIFYAVTLGIFILTFLVAVDINGARSWLQVGSFQFQPAEFGKTTTALMLAKYMSMITGQARTFKNKLIAYLILECQWVLSYCKVMLALQWFMVSLVFVIYREGFPVYEVLFVLFIGLCFVFSMIFGGDPVAITLSIAILIYVGFSSLKLIRKEKVKGIAFLATFVGAILLFLLGGEVMSLNMYLIYAGTLGLLFASWYLVRKIKYFKIWWPVVIYVALLAFVIFGVKYITTSLLEDYQVQRIETLLGMSDNADAEYNVTQSKMTIGSGGVAGKGYLQGTLTQSEQVPEQSTDFIFCTIGEEFGFLGTFVFLVVYLLFLLRIIFIAERQRSPFSRVYAYCVASFFFLQIMINVGMTIGLIPVIGIPLPFISYGGSSVLAFSILVFIMLRLDADRLLILR
jgi:rod shape determining protein RodA